MVRPTLEYAAEVWGGGNWPQADCIQNAAGRTILGLHRFSAVEVARGELGWLSMQARREIKQLKYWGKLLKMEDARLPKIVYRQCKNRTAGLKGSFCYSINSILGNLNLGHLWISEEIGEYNDWVSVVRAAVKRKDTDMWLLAMQEKSKLRLYRTLKTDLKPEEYLSWTVSAQQRALYAQLRSGTHQLRIEVGRWSL